MSFFRLLPALTIGLLLSCAPRTHVQVAAQPTAQSLALQQSFQALSPTLAVSGLKLQPQTDGGTLVSGQLDRAPFILRFPAQWNHQSAVFAHGYTTVSDRPEHLPADPVAVDETKGLLPAAYADGFVVGQSAYDKQGFAVDSGIRRTVALSQLLGALGATRAYILGGSEGGSIAELAAERYPNQFAGALAACGVVGGWEKEINYATNLRALYNYFAAGTGYALPGIQDATRTAQVKAASALFTLFRLYTAAQLRPQGVAAHIIARTVSAMPEVKTQGDLGTLGLTLLSQMTGIEDFSAQAGGVFVDNSQTVYHSPLLNDAENAALNRGIQRYHADPQALKVIRERFVPTGKFSAKLLSVHNVYDPLVPTEHENWLRDAVAAANNSANLDQMLVPTAYSKLPTKLIGFQAADHCGFAPQQSARAWEALRHWTETGVRPPANLH